MSHGSVDSIRTQKDAPLGQPLWSVLTELFLSGRDRGLGAKPVSRYLQYATATMWKLLIDPSEKPDLQRRG